MQYLESFVWTSGVDICMYESNKHLYGNMQGEMAQLLFIWY